MNIHGWVEKNTVCDDTGGCPNTGVLSSSYQVLSRVTAKCSYSKYMSAEIRHHVIYFMRTSSRNEVFSCQNAHLLESELRYDFRSLSSTRQMINHKHITRHNDSGMDKSRIRFIPLQTSGLSFSSLTCCVHGFAMYVGRFRPRNGDTSKRGPSQPI